MLPFWIALQFLSSLPIRLPGMPQPQELGRSLLTDRFGRRPVLLSGLCVYAVTTEGGRLSDVLSGYIDPDDGIAPPVPPAPAPVTPASANAAYLKNPAPEYPSPPPRGLDTAFTTFLNAFLRKPI